MIIKTADRIKELRMNKNISQADLARAMYVTRSSVNAWEMGISIPSTEKIVELASFFHVTTDYIMGTDDRKVVDVSSLSTEELNIIHRLLYYFDSIHNNNQSYLGLHLVILFYQITRFLLMILSYQIEIIGEQMYNHYKFKVEE